MIFNKDARGEIVGISIARTTLLVVALLAAPFLLLGTWFTVSPGYAGVITRAGSVQDTIYDEGFHFKLPVIDTDRAINIQTLTFIGKEIDAGTKDLQSVTAEIAVIYSVDKVDAKEVYRNYRDTETLQSRALQPVIEEAFKSAASLHTAEQLITQRATLRDKVIAAVRQGLQPHYVTVKDVNITNFKFSPGFTASVEGKVKAEQDAKRAEHDLVRIKTEAEQAVVKAKAGAEAIKMQAEAIQKQGGAEYVQLKWIEKWNGALPTTQLGANTAAMLPVGK